MKGRQTAHEKCLRLSQRTCVKSFHVSTRRLTKLPSRPRLPSTRKIKVSDLIRVLIADDSAVLRRIVAEALTQDEGFEVFDAVDGRDAVDQVHRINPDVVVLDVEMPVMNGVEATKIIRELDSKLPIIMFCSSSVENRDATTAALEYGANDCVVKTMRIGYVTAAIQHLRDQLAPKIRLWAERRANSTKGNSGKSSASEVSNFLGTKRFDIVVVGAASAGPLELTTLLNDFPEDFDLPILISHHMPPALTQLLLDQIDIDCPLPVIKATQDHPLMGNRVWFAPGGSNLTIEFDFNQYFLSIDHGLPENPGR
ncbi:MAG: response regulator, partial [Planctomycetes bacterium]|nr:response regulator [Planctomycetota bacterium]